MVQNAALAATPVSDAVLVPAGASGTAGAAQYRGVGTSGPLASLVKLVALRQKVKYVFVIFQENRSFDHYFGTYPGANGLFDNNTHTLIPATATNGVVQPILNSDGTYGTISPFLIPKTIIDTQSNKVQIYPEATASVDHSHTGMVYGAHFKETPNPKTAQNDGYALDEEKLRFSGAGSDTSTVVLQSTGVTPASGYKPTLAQKQMAELTMGHVDCDTIPFLWNYADRFTLFDNFHQTTIGPSTPNAIAMIAGQTGETQWALHNSTTSSGIANSVPIVGDPGPFPGSNATIAYQPPSPPPPAPPAVVTTISGDTSATKPPYGPDESASTSTSSGSGAAGVRNVNGNLTFASLPLSFMGSKLSQIIKSDQNPGADLLDVQHDMAKISSSNPNVNWGWYQQGFGPEPFDTTNLAGGAYYPGCNSSSVPYSNVGSACLWQTHASYIVHHNGPQYFGYLGDNTAELKNMHGLQQFYTDVANKALPAQGGVFYVRGGYANNDGLTPLVPNNSTTPHQQSYFAGNDDHPAYSDAMISEAMVADTVNAIANSPYWNQSAIIITYDETDGMYDHAPMNIRSWDPSGYPLTGGPRIPAIVVSPYSSAHTISHAYSEHSSVIKFINELFGLVPLADLPDEQKGRKLGKSQLGQSDLGPADDLVNPMGDLLEAFDIERLLGVAPKLPPSYATIAGNTVTSLPHYGRAGCAALKITPTDYPNGLANPPSDPAPADFNPRPGTAPGIPAQGKGTSTTALTYPWQP